MTNESFTTMVPERVSETPELLPSYFARIDKGTLLTHEEEVDLASRAKAGDARARQRLVEKNLRLVVSAVQRAVADKGRTIRIPVHRGDKIRKMARVYNGLSAELEREPTDEEVAGRLDWSVEEVRDIKGSLWDATSLNQPVGSDADSTEVGELVEDERSSDTVGEVIRDLETSGLGRALERLPERQRHVLIKRYGLGDNETATLAQLSDELGVSRERVRQLQREAERTLRMAA
jgi:RNA polymerase primary sigma factor